MAAAALPALAQASTQPTETQLSVATSSYREDGVNREDVLTGSARRYEIDVHQFQLTAPVGESWSAGLAVSREIMSGASPAAGVQGIDGTPRLIMSGASIRDARNATDLSITKHLDRGAISTSIMVSNEDDYESYSGVVNGELDLGDGLTTLGAGFSYAEDTLEPSDALVTGRIEQESRFSSSGTLSVTRVINARTVLQGGLSYTRHSGFLSDPYKLLDVRPATRERWSLSARLRHFVAPAHAAWHLDYRSYQDNWGVDAHTLETAWYQNLGGGVQLVPWVRYYTQDGAAFFDYTDDFTAPPDQHKSSDHRLAPFGAFSYGVRFHFRAPRWGMRLGVERYTSSGDYGLSNAELNHPAEVQFTRASIGWDLRF